MQACNRCGTLLPLRCKVLHFEAKFCGVSVRLSGSGGSTSQSLAQQLPQQESTIERSELMATAGWVVIQTL
jgi:hypothetical protein